LYTLFGSAHQVAILANALLDACTAALLVPLVTRLFDGRTGAIAGLLYAVWPGMIFLCGTHMSEPLFNLLLVGTLLATVHATQGRERRTRYAALAGLLLGAAALVKAEPLILLPAIA
jgi:4-amino-4-deoxy-L-arabinose transferase-like glycosyltransferase